MPADGRKTQKELVTIKACANTSGIIKLPLLLIGKYKNPRCFKNFRHYKSPVMYMCHKNALVNSALFTERFHHHFVPYAQKTLAEMKLEPRAVLALDNFSAHPEQSELVSWKSCG